MPPVLQDEAALELKDKLLPPDTLEAKVEIFFFTSGLPQDGQVTPSMMLALRTSSSKGFWHVLHTNSKSGIVGSCDKSIGNLEIRQLGNGP